MTKGHAAALYGLVQAVLPASDWNMCKRTIAVPQELGRTLFAPRRNPGRRYRTTNSRPSRLTRPRGSENNEYNRGTAKRRKRSAALIVPMKLANSSQLEPVEGSETPDSLASQVRPDGRDRNL